jgi:pimeloyl-ACP methyl ester carboxylesterase
VSTFVLVHGSWLDGSAWADVVQRLKYLGHNAFAPTVAGHGKGVRKDVSHAESTQSIVDFIVERNLSDIVLLGHSYGGTIISKVVEEIPDRVRRLVYLNALVLNDGECAFDLLPAHLRELFAGLAEASADNTMELPFNVWREAFVNDADLDLARWTYEQLSPEPHAQVLERLDLKKFYTLDTPRSFLLCSEDTALPPGEWWWHPKISSRLGMYRFVQMPGGHVPFFTNPNGLADKIVEAGRD